MEKLDKQSLARKNKKKRIEIKPEKIKGKRLSKISPQFKNKKLLSP